MCMEKQVKVVVKVKVAQSCPPLCDPVDYTVHGILQVRTLERVVFPFSRGIFPAQGSIPVLPHCGQILYQLSHQGSMGKQRDKKLLKNLVEVGSHSRINCGTLLNGTWYSYKNRRRKKTEGEITTATPNDMNYMTPPGTMLNKRAKQKGNHTKVFHLYKVQNHGTPV